MVCSFVKLTIKQTKTLIFRDRCLSLFYGVLFPLNEVQICPVDTPKLAYDGVMKVCFKFLFLTWEVSCTNAFWSLGAECYSLSSATGGESLAEKPLKSG